MTEGEHQIIHCMLLFITSLVLLLVSLLAAYERCMCIHKYVYLGL